MIHGNILYLNTAFVTVHLGEAAWKRYSYYGNRLITLIQAVVYLQLLRQPPDHINPGSCVFTIIKTTT